MLNFANMIHISDKSLCCGCSACAQSCPKKCISMIEDEEGFLYPNINNNICVDCGLCEKVCPVINSREPREPRIAFAAINLNEEIRMKSSSGGIFTMIAERIIDDNGVVFGARFDENWEVMHDYTENKNGLEAFRCSKYVQSRIGNTYKQAKIFLEQGRKVLFSGTSCQIAGLHHFLKKKYENLLTVDFVCHGTPSPKVWKMYLNEITTNCRNAISDIQFRNKDKGWSQFNFKISYSKLDKEYVVTARHDRDLYMRAFLNELILRPSCYNCKAKCGSCLSDITLGDYWGVRLHHPDMDDNKGTGLVLINSNKGEEILNDPSFKKENTDWRQAVIHNVSYYESVIPHRNRKDFFNKLNTSKNISKLIQEELKLPFREWCLYQALRAKSLIKRIFRKMFLGG